MESQGGEEEAFANPIPEWDLAAEEELVAIEAAYLSKRNRSLLDQDSDASSLIRCPKGRRLPDWDSPAAAAAAPKSTTLANALDSPSPTDTLSKAGKGIWNLAPHPKPVNSKVRYPALTFGGRIVYCRTPPEVEHAALELLRKVKAVGKNMNPVSLGFDIEWRPVFGRGEAPRKAAVIQICMDFTDCYVMHVIHSGIPPILKSLLEDASYVKVGVCIANDAIKMRNDYNICVEPLEDLSDLANLKLGAAPRKWSLSGLTEMLTCKQLEKPSKVRMGNWETDYLSKAQLTYAATDAYASWYLYQVLKSFADVKD